MIRKEHISREDILIDNQNGVVPVPPDGQVILFEQFTIIRRSWKWVLLVSILISAAVGFYVMTMVPKEYLGVAIALPPNKSGTPLDNLMGGISSSLKDVGLSKLVGGKSGSAGYSQTVLMTSGQLLDSLINKYDLYSDYEIPRDRPDIMRDALAGNIEVDIGIEGPITVNVFDRDPKQAAAMANDIVMFTNSISRELNRRETEPISKYLGDRYDYYSRRQDTLGERLQMFMTRNKIYDPEKQAAIIGQSIQAAETEVARARAALTVTETQLGPDDPKTALQRQIVAEAEKRSRALAEGRAGAIASMPIANAPAAAREFAQLQVDYEANSRTLALLEPMYLTTKFDEVRNIPVLQMLDKAVPPFKKARPRYSIVIAASFVGAFVLCYVIVAVISYYRAFKRRYLHYTNGYLVTRSAPRIDATRPDATRIESKRPVEDKG
jgi:tyrosine-protein kinase Etk/Wzc